MDSDTFWCKFRQYIWHRFFYLAYLLTFFLAVVPTAIWRSRFRPGGAHSDLVEEEEERTALIKYNNPQVGTR